MNQTENRLARVITWPPQDERWEGFRHFIERVSGAGIGLVSQDDRSLVLDKHVLPSLEGLDLLPKSGKILDVGSGGGFPAIPLAMARPDLEWLLVDSNLRKTEFLRRVSRETKLYHVAVQCERVENLGSELNGQFEAVTARAVTEISDIVGWTKRFLKPEGRWLLWKSTEWKKEKLPEGIEMLQERKLSHGGMLVEMGMRPEERRKESII